MLKLSGGKKCEYGTRKINPGKGVNCLKNKRRVKTQAHTAASLEALENRRFRNGKTLKKKRQKHTAASLEAQKTRLFRNQFQYY